MRKILLLMLVFVMALAVVSLAGAATDRLDRPRLAQCSDGIDNDGDGLVDEEDPGCSTRRDQTEDDRPLPEPTVTPTATAAA